MARKPTSATNMFVGIEAIQRNVSSYNSNDGDDTKHQSISLRAGFKF